MLKYRYTICMTVIFINVLTIVIDRARTVQPNLRGVESVLYELRSSVQEHTTSTKKQVAKNSRARLWTGVRYSWGIVQQRPVDSARLSISIGVSDYITVKHFELKRLNETVCEKLRSISRFYRLRSGLR